MTMLAQNWLLGTWLIAGLVFVEAGPVVMPFFQGDPLLFAAGAILGLTGTSPLAPMAIVAFAAIAGCATNYMIDRSSLGQTVVCRNLVKPKHLAQTREFFDRYGGVTITVGRFIPIVRTVAPFLAGLTGMRVRQFAMYNVVCGLVWCGLLIMAGFWLYQVVRVREHLHWLSLAIVALSVLPVAWHMLAGRRKMKEIAHASVAGRG